MDEEGEQEWATRGRARRTHRRWSSDIGPLGMPVVAALILWRCSSLRGGHLTASGPSAAAAAALASASAAFLACRAHPAPPPVGRGARLVAGPPASRLSHAFSGGTELQPSFQLKPEKKVRCEKHTSSASEACNASRQCRRPACC